MLACRPVRRLAQSRTPISRGALAGLAAGVALLAAAGAHSQEPGSLHHESERLRSASARLTSESHAVLLELYALESRLARVEGRLAAVRQEAEAVELRREAARDHLAVVQRTLGTAESRLARRLRDLYVQGDPDPLAVLLGAESLDEAIATLENLGDFASQDVEIVTQVKKARRAVRSALRGLIAREAELRAVLAEVEATRRGLVQARTERTSYLAQLRRERRVNEAALARLTARAAAIEAQADEIEAEGPVAEPVSASTSTSPPPPAPSPPPAPASPGTQLTVVATGYSLRGTTATGMPVGWGVVAVDPSVIPLGTRMTIPGYGEGVAADTGSAVHGAMIDLWFPTEAEAHAWGRRTVTITLR